MIALFISDLHLCPQVPRTTQMFFHFLKQQATQAQQLYLLGDIFEYWAGDDDMTPYNCEIIAALRAVHDQGTQLFWISGNRDFLVGQDFAIATGISFLQDPCVVKLARHPIALTHGDAQCTDDIAYMQFRYQVRQPSYQQQFLSLPLAQRKSIIADLRKNSQKSFREKPSDIMDVNAEAIRQLFAQTQTHILIHGHTHRPAIHVDNADGVTRSRYVLPDWEYDATPTRGGWISLGLDGLLHRFDAHGVETASN